MCGIAGVMVPVGQQPDPVLVQRMADALAHRGPDGRGTRIRDNVALAQVRLSIIDLEGGRQPIEDAEGRAIIANGEIYNYIELKAEMPKVRFATGSDCEPPLHMYAAEGDGFAARLRGMYALAIHDPHHGRLILTRDPFGIKPLYVAEGPWGVAFASEPQAILASGLVPRAADTAITRQLLQLQFTCGTETIFPGIRRLAPGETVVIEDGRIQSSRFLSPLPTHSLPHAQDDEDHLLHRLDQVLMESVDLHQRSDVPYGMFLSGGIDSSALLAMMARLNPQPVLAFTAGFPDTNVHDEREHARQLAQSVGARHVEVEFDEDDFWSLLPRVAEIMDDPALDYATLPTFKLAQVARQQVKVILAGEGGDELFGGYGRYRGAMRPWPFTRRLRSTGTFDPFGRVLAVPTTGWRDGMKMAEQWAAKQPWSRLQQAQAVDCADWLPNDLLIKADRCLMANGIEGRVPFLDPIVADFAFSLPDRWKMHKKSGKWLLRRWLDKVMPQARPFEKKRGFTVPVAHWIANEPHLAQLMSLQPCIAEIAHPQMVKELFGLCNKKSGFACWSLLFYALWHRHHVQGKKLGGDVLTTLADLS